ncbi:SH3 domain-containing protein [Aeromonas media]|uniref:SH3 domain-containing protein n=1 Tax=Aeromonas media TaxID=651 RepID=UPI003CFCFB96
MAIKRTVLLLSLFVLLIIPAHAKNCKKGQPCGNSCISWSKTCRINAYSYQLATPSTSSTSSTSSSPSTSSTPTVYERKETTLKSSNVLVRYVIPSKLNVRAKPNTSSYIATRLIKGDFVLLYKVEGKWAYVSKREIYGWVKDEYLSLSPVT